jgi:phospholipid/cholesterol/gamma-HCH transport system ATP-binding protein
VTTQPTPSAATGQALVELRDVHYRVGSRALFSGVNVTVQRGSITAVMGPSGTGKTTLLRLITGQIAPSAGTVTVFGRDLATLRRADVFAMRKRMGMLFQNGALLTDLDVFENVAFPLREHTRLPETVLRTLVLMKLQAVGLRGAATLMPQQLSGGMARRVALARAIVMDPEILIYDEPFVGLDPISMGVVARLIRSLNDALGITSIVVSHDVQEVGAIADQSFIVADGTVIASGTSEQLQSSQQPAVQQFLQGAADGPVPFHYPAVDYRTDLAASESAR